MAATTTTERTTVAVCQEVFSPMRHRGSLATERFRDQLRILYVASDAIDERDATYVKLGWCETKRELWICYLQVASVLRGRGWGRRLVATSERLACRLNAHTIHVLPLHQARGFWLAMGYEPHATTSRVLTKSPTAQ